MGKLMQMIRKIFSILNKENMYRDILMENDNLNSAMEKFDEEINQ